SFVGDAWKEWNGPFRDDVRDFFRAVPGSLRRAADRLVGSPEIYRHKEREAEQSINFVTCHDGFTLNNLVSYNQKHNEAHGEAHREGANDNRSWNCGVEGPTDDPGVETLRNRQVKNFMTVTLVSLGIPMILMGDEVRHTQGGNNNTYCQDNAISWFDWTRLEKHADVHRFLRLLMERRQLATVQHQQRVSLSALLTQAEKTWHGVRLDQPDWGDHSHGVALGGTLRPEGLRYHLILNAFWEPLDFELPALGAEGAWRRWIDTALDPPNDIVPWQAAPAVLGEVYRAQARSVVMLIASGGGNSWE